jgi:hypothetical protein
MAITPGERLARVLDGSRAPGAFSVQPSVPARDVRLTVAGSGPISFPVKAPQAKRMIACARPARFGRGEQTLMELSVRETWKIMPDQVTLTGSPHTLVLTKTGELFRREAKARIDAVAGLEWLDAQWRRYRGTGPVVKHRGAVLGPGHSCGEL